MLFSLHVFSTNGIQLYFLNHCLNYTYGWSSMILQVRILITQLKTVTTLLYLLLCISYHAGCSKTSVYGSNCDTPCPENCKDNTCHIHSGSCFNCKPGWSGMYCNTSKITFIPRKNLTISCFFYVVLVQLCLPLN